MKIEKGSNRHIFHNNDETERKPIRHKHETIAEKAGMFRDVFLVLFGVMISIFITVYLRGELFRNLILSLVTLILATIFVTLPFVNNIQQYFWKLRRISNARKGKYLIGVIRAGKPFEVDSEKWKSQINDPPKWSGVTAKEWKDRLSEVFNGSKVTYVDPRDDFTRFNCIVNPFGGMYYEESFTDQKSLHKILKYISDGGIYVNVSDIPFFYAYNIETDMWLYNSPGFTVLSHFINKNQDGSFPNISTTASANSFLRDSQEPNFITQGTLPINSTFGKNLDVHDGLYVDYNYYIFKYLGITFLMPVGGGTYGNLSEKIQIFYKPIGNSKGMKVAGITTKDTRPFFIPETFSKIEKITISDIGDGKLSALNWLNQEYTITPLASLPNGKGKLIISTTSMYIFPDMASIILQMIKDNLSESHSN
ncbi:MAG: hypothetical protein M1477_02020 [Candidatus Thermoplasmatota archaeon]|nr:hypothetical protein [Candidatus Thermoplasmatota archaeon]